METALRGAVVLDIDGGARGLFVRGRFDDRLRDRAKGAINVKLLAPAGPLLSAIGQESRWVRAIVGGTGHVEQAAAEALQEAEAGEQLGVSVGAGEYNAELCLSAREALCWRRSIDDPLVDDWIADVSRCAVGVGPLHTNAPKVPCQSVIGDGGQRWVVLEAGANARISEARAKGDRDGSHP